MSSEAFQGDVAEHGSPKVTQADISRAITLGERWLLSSGIQETQTGTPMRGGLHAWYDLPKASFSFFYTEITGYAVTTMLYLYLTDRARFGVLDYL